MTRWDSADNQSAAASTTVSLVTFADLQIPGDRLRLSDAPVTISWGGNDWTGIGQYGGIDVVSESIDVIAMPVKLSLSGVDASLVNDAMTTNYHGKNVTIYIGLFNVTTMALVDTPEEIWSGYMDVMTIDIDRGSAVISLDCEHRLRRQTAAFRYTDEDQRSLYPTDLFFNKLHLIPQYRGKWGARDMQYSQGGGRLGGGGFDERREQD